MSEWVGSFDCVLFDLDGTLYTDDVAMPGAPDAVARVRAIGVRPVFMTNNSSRTPTGVAGHLRSLGFAAEAQEVVTSATVTASVLRERGIRTAYVVGREGLREALEAAGVTVAADEAGEVEAVVVGWDPEVTYGILRAASVLVQRGATLIGSNPDRTFPAPDGSRWPGAGALLAAVEATTDTRAEIIGKPFAPLYLAARETGGGGRTLVVGDRLDTDIAGAEALGWDSLLVLWGISTMEDLEDSPVRPTKVAEDLSALFTPA